MSRQTDLLVPRSLRMKSSNTYHVSLSLLLALCLYGFMSSSMVFLKAMLFTRLRKYFSSSFFAAVPAWYLVRYNASSVAYFRTAWRTSQPKLRKTKKLHPVKNSLYIRKWNFLALILKRFLYFRKWNPTLYGLNSQIFP